MGYNRVWDGVRGARERYGVARTDRQLITCGHPTYRRETAAGNPTGEYQNEDLIALYDSINE